MLFVAIPDCMLTSCLTDDKSIDSVNLLNPEGFMMAVIGFVIIILISRISKYKKNMLEFIIPYSLMSVFAASVYFYAHHLVIVSSFVLFFLIIVEERAKIIKKRKLKVKSTMGRPSFLPKAGDSFTDELDLSFLVHLLLLLSLIIPMSWTLYSSILEINTNYSSGVELSRYIKENKLEDLSILYSPSESDISSKEKGELKVSSTVLPVIAALLPQNKNFYKFYDGEKFILYSPNVFIDKKDRRVLYKNWKDKGYPDILIGEFDFSQITNYDSKDKEDNLNKKNMLDYVCIKVLKGAKIYKYYQEYPTVAAAKKVYIKKDLLKKYRLKEIDWTKEK